MQLDRARITTAIMMARDFCAKRQRPRRSAIMCLGHARLRFGLVFVCSFVAVADADAVVVLKK